MTFLKRAATAMVLFFFFFVVIYLGICAVGGGVAGARAGSTNPQESFERGRQAGERFVQQNLGTILISSFGISVVASIALSFSGLLPWCRKPVAPPALPARMG